MEHEKITKEQLKQAIFEAFKDVPKGNGLGVRECAALDDYANEDALSKARVLDIEQHWWKYPDELKDSAFNYALTYNNKDGIKFHLPALMAAALDGRGNTVDVSVYSTLCVKSLKAGTPPHHGHKEYLDFLRTVKVSDFIEYYNFTPRQVHAIALYFMEKGTKSGWFMDDEWYYGVSWEEIVAGIKEQWERVITALEKPRGQDSFVALAHSVNPGSDGHILTTNYSVTLDEAVAIAAEEKRIIYEWFKAGGIKYEI